MRIFFGIATAASITVVLASPTSAQLADKRSFLHPLGVWSNHYFVAQKQVYPRRARIGFHAPHPADAELIWTSDGGGLLYERNW